MNRENFYLLLDLPATPPEKDPQKIEAAIKKKQTQWSRFRNHPTKAIQAQKYIDMIPEIRRVMLDPELLEKEAQAMLAYIETLDKEKYASLDRHIRVFLSKGFVSEHEITKLVTFHKIEENAIRKRIEKQRTDSKNDTTDPSDKLLNRKELQLSEKHAKIDAYLFLRTALGYITEKQLNHLAAQYEIPENTLKQRIKLPILKNDETEAAITPLDKSVEKIIQDNLKIISKRTLYDFLDQPENADLSVIEAKSKQRRAEILKISKKNAIVTASGILAGHCLAIFKSEENRISYDMSLASYHFSGFHSAIDMAAINGKIPSAHFTELLNIAEEFGLHRNDGNDYIVEYCKSKKWKVASPQRKKRIMTITAISIMAIVIFTFGSIFAYNFIQFKKIQKEYQVVLGTVEHTHILEEKKRLLEIFLHSPRELPTKIANDIGLQLQVIDKEIKQRDTLDKKNYLTLSEHAQNALAKNNFDDAYKRYKEYTDTHPLGHYVEEVKQKVSQIHTLEEDYHMTQLTQIEKKDYDRRINAYLDYLKKYPESHHKKTVEKMKSEMRDDYYNHFKKKLENCEKRQVWNECIALCNDFLNIYPDHNRKTEIKGMQYYFWKKMKK